MFSTCSSRKKRSLQRVIDQTIKQGFVSARIDGEFTELTQGLMVDRYKTHNIEVVIDRFVISSKSEQRIADSIRLALEMADGNALAVQDAEGKTTDKLFSQKLFDLESGLAYEVDTEFIFI